MLDDLACAQDLDDRTHALLKQADAYGRFPTPVDDIVEAAGLRESADFTLDEGLLGQMPKALRSVIRRSWSKVSGALDRREKVVHVSADVTLEAKRRFIKLHEVTHGILPHQQSLLYADNDETLSPATKMLFEQEANQGAAELLFQRGHFAGDARSLAIGPEAVVHLSQRFGASLHATFRRYAEVHDAAVLVIRTALQENPDGTWTRNEQPCSARWREQFGDPDYPRQMQPHEHPFLAALHYPIGELQLADRNGLTQAVRVEAFSNRYSQFLMLWVPPRKRLLRAVRVRAVD